MAPFNWGDGSAAFLCVHIGVPSDDGAGCPSCSSSSIRGHGLECTDDQVLLSIGCTFILWLLWMVDDHVWVCSPPPLFKVAEAGMPNTQPKADKKLSPLSTTWTVLARTQSTLPIRVSALVHMTWVSLCRVQRYDPAETSLWCWRLWLENKCLSSIIWSSGIMPTSLSNWIVGVIDDSVDKVGGDIWFGRGTTSKLLCDHFLLFWVGQSVCFP